MIEVRKAEDPLLTSITRTIVDALDPEQVVLFGSRARGDYHGDSDYDLMVVMESDLQPADRAAAVHDLFLRRHWSMDVVVYTPAEIARWSNSVGTIAYTAVHEGHVVYERR